MFFKGNNSHRQLKGLATNARIEIKINKVNKEKPLLKDRRL